MAMPQGGALLAYRSSFPDRPTWSWKSQLFEVQHFKTQRALCNAVYDRAIMRSTEDPIDKSTFPAVLPHGRPIQFRARQ